MTYDHILEVARKHAPAVPPFHFVWDARVGAARPGRRPSRSIATGVALAAAVALTLWSAVTFGLEAWSLSAVEPTRFAVAMTSLLLLGAGLLGPVLLALGVRRSRSLVGQLLLRAACWSMLELCVLATFLAGPEVTGAPSWMAAALFFGATLLLMGTDGLAEIDGMFQPVAYRGRLLAILVLAFADAQTLIVLTGMQLGVGFPVPLILVPTLGALAMIVVVWGLARLRGWALLFNVAVNLVVATLAIAGYVTTAIPVVVGLVGTAIVQVVLAAPVLHAALGDTEAPTEAATPFAWARAAVVTLMLTAATATAIVLLTGAPVTTWPVPR